jgi:hypothetical protein
LNRNRHKIDELDDKPVGLRPVPPPHHSVATLGHQRFRSRNRDGGDGADSQPLARRKRRAGMTLSNP